jgi:hypothetical protein
MCEGAQGGEKRRTAPKLLPPQPSYCLPFPNIAADIAEEVVSISPDIGYNLLLKSQ